MSSYKGRYDRKVNENKIKIFLDQMSDMVIMTENKIEINLREVKLLNIEKHPNFL